MKCLPLSRAQGQRHQLTAIVLATNKKARCGKQRAKAELTSTYFCHVRFLCRFALSRLRRLCFDIFNRRFFFRLPMDWINECSTVRSAFSAVKPEFAPLSSSYSRTARCTRVKISSPETSASANPVNRAAARR